MGVSLRLWATCVPVIREGKGLMSDKDDKDRETSKVQTQLRGLKGY
jgi:hypothetical protein